MKILSKLICKIRDHQLGRVQRLNPAFGHSKCKRCGDMITVPMRTPYSRKKAAEANGAQTRG